MEIDLNLTDEVDTQEPMEEEYWANVRFKIKIVDGKPKIEVLQSFCCPSKRKMKPKKEKRHIVTTQEPMTIQEEEF